MRVRGDRDSWKGQLGGTVGRIVLEFRSCYKYGGMLTSTGGGYIADVKVEASYLLRLLSLVIIVA